MAGYNKRERWEVFDADGWYHSGDRVYRRAADPRLFYVGRDSELIKAAGSASPREVEAVIEEYPEVSQCLVVGVDHPSRGEEVCAVIVPAVAEIDIDELILRTRRLIRAKVPTRWILARDTDLPSLASGKPDRRTVRRPVSAAGILR